MCLFSFCIRRVSVAHVSFLFVETLCARVLNVDFAFFVELQLLHFAPSCICSFGIFFFGICNVHPSGFHPGARERR